MIRVKFKWHERTSCVTSNDREEVLEVHEVPRADDQVRLGNGPYRTVWQVNHHIENDGYHQIYVYLR